MMKDWTTLHQGQKVWFKTEDITVPGTVISLHDDYAVAVSADGNSEFIIGDDTQEEFTW